MPLTFASRRATCRLGLIATGIVLAGAALAALASGDAPAVAAAALLVVIGLLVLTAGRTGRARDDQTSRRPRSTS